MGLELEYLKNSTRRTWPLKSRCAASCRREKSDRCESDEEGSHAHGDGPGLDVVSNILVNAPIDSQPTPRLPPSPDSSASRLRAAPPRSHPGQRRAGRTRPGE